MADQKPVQQPGPSKSVSAAVAAEAAQSNIVIASPLSRREEFAARFGAAILQGNSHKKAWTLAKEVTELVDAFLAELDKPRG